MLKESQYLVTKEARIAFRVSRIFNQSEACRVVPREVGALVRDIHEALDVPLDEAEVYVSSLINGGYAPADAKGKEVAKSLGARGMLILDAKGRSYLPVHPRMAISNLFRASEERQAKQRKEKRLLVDKLTLELIPLMPGESKGTNASNPRGARTATR